jgi:hypothetical protein
MGIPNPRRVSGPLDRTLNPAIPPNDSGTLNVGATPPPTSVGMEVSSLVNDSNFERLIEAMEADATEADAEWQSNLNNVLFTFFAPNVLAEYKADGTDCEDARGTFNYEWNQIVLGRGDPKNLLAAYDIYSLRIGALQRANERIDALIEINFAKLLGPFLNWVMRMKKFDLALKFQRDLAKLKTELEEAGTEVTKAEVKTLLNVAVSAVTLIVAPEATLAKLLLAGGGMAAHIVIDQSLGEGSVVGTVVFVGGDGGEFVELSKAGKEAIHKLPGKTKTIGVAGAAITAALDIHDIYKGKERVEKLNKELEDVGKEYDELLSGVLPMTKEFVMLDKLIQSVPANLQKALDAGNDAAKNYDAVKWEIQAAIREGK